MWADTVTLRVGDQLVGVRPDSDATADRIRRHFADQVDDTAAVGEHGDQPVPWAFSVRLEPEPAGRGPRAVPQLRLGRSLLARSRRPNDVVDALDLVLGGVLARQDEERRWLGLRTFVVGDRAVLVQAGRPALIADPQLARGGVTELPTWSVAVHDDTVTIPAPLTAVAVSDSLDGVLAGATSCRLVGLVALDPCSHAADGPTAGDGPDAADRSAGEPRGDRAAHDAEHHPSSPGAQLARFAARHPSSHWFHTVERLVDDGRVHISTDRAVAAGRIRRLLTDGTTG